MSSNTDMVNHPSHYNTGKIEVIEFLEDQQLEPHEWNAVKYICRAKHKGKRVEDLEKAVWYLQRKLEILEAEKDGREVIRPNDMNRPKVSAGTLMKLCEHGCVAPFNTDNFQLTGEWIEVIVPADNEESEKKILAFEPAAEDFVATHYKVGDTVTLRGRL